MFLYQGEYLLQRCVCDQGLLERGLGVTASSTRMLYLTMRLAAALSSLPFEQYCPLSTLVTGLVT